jgi:type VI protein secretion system component Hcp
MTIDPRVPEISLEDLANVAGGNKSSPQLASHCATGSHIKEVSITARDGGVTLNYGHIEVTYVAQKSD